MAKVSYQQARRLYNKNVPVYICCDGNWIGPFKKYKEEVEFEKLLPDLRSSSVLDFSVDGTSGRIH